MSGTSLVPQPASGLFDRGGATIDATGAYRYRLWRQWGDGGTVVFVMLNPSTADGSQDDPTIRKCRGFAQRWGYGRLEVVNLFAWRATDPKTLPSVAEPVGGENDSAIVVACRLADRVVAAWGSEPFAVKRARDVASMLAAANVTLHCLKVSKEGRPWHPLYVPYAAVPQVYPPLTDGSRTPRRAQHED